MDETRWAELGGERLRYGEHTWELTGTAELRGTGEQLAVRARRADDVAHDAGTLTFALVEGPGSPNPGNLGEASVSLEREGGGHYLVVEIEPRTYRYELQRVAYE